ncbi:MAG TPA: DUF2851 family protein [Saprospiraceae bacterium]|nr:DUF2851 family protein [Saprospiraceae bacterium]HMQ83410.1 DUF2851 family protein [Saprospiraceae bacterium]
MKENFLHYIWRLRLFDFSNLYSTCGTRIEVLHPGILNTHSGPDFTNARLQLDDTLWAGNVEIHLRSSDWIKHQHQLDKAYDNVILHVVLEEDEPLYRNNGERLPCLELKRLISPGLVGKYLRLLHSEYWIPCQHQFHEVPAYTQTTWLERMGIERLEQKSSSLEATLETLNGNWEALLYQSLFRSLGAAINADAFEQLARHCPLNLLAKHRHSLFQMEALLFGQAGFLDGNFQDNYPQQLQKEYNFLKQKYQLQAMPEAAWHFMRLRPAGFPIIRIAEMAMLLSQTNHLFSKIMAAKNIQELENLFEVRLSNYWVHHYALDKTAAKKQKRLGKSAVHGMIINAVVPIIFLYGKRMGEHLIKEKALGLLEQLPPEDNHIIRKWQALGQAPETAFQSQALLHLKKAYCSEKRCLECAIGNRVLNRNNQVEEAPSNWQLTWELNLELEAMEAGR